MPKKRKIDLASPVVQARIVESIGKFTHEDFERMRTFARKAQEWDEQQERGRAAVRAAAVSVPPVPCVAKGKK